MQAPPKLSAATALAMDFPDRIGPVLVKELRQALRSRGFLISWILLHGLLAVGFVWASLFGPADARNFVQAVVWASIQIPLLILFPARALFSVREEVVSQSLDLLQLTSLSPLRIALAKLLAIVTQALLYTLSLVPVLALRYFFGSVDILTDLQKLYGYFVLGTAGVSVCLVLSSMTLPMMILGGLTVLVFLQIGSAFVHFLLSDLGGAPHVTFANLVLVSLLVLALLSGLCILLTAKSLAPRATSYARWLRLLPLAALLVVGLLTLAGKAVLDPGVALMIASLIAFLWFLQSLTDILDPVDPLPITVRRIGASRFGVIQCWLFSPGWASASIWITVSGAFVALALWLGWLREASPSDRPVGIFAVIGLLVAALLSSRVLPLLLPRSVGGRRWLPVAFLILGILGGVFQVGYLASLQSWNSGMSHPEMAYVTGWYPSAAFILSLVIFDKPQLTSTFLMLAGGHLLVAWLVLVTRGRSHFRRLWTLAESATEP